MIQEDRKLWKTIVFGILTCGIYNYFFIYKIAMDANVICSDDGKKTSGLVPFILLSLLTCGIYAWFWYYSLGNRLQENAPRYGLNFTENGTTILLWLLFGSLLCGVGGFVALHILITNMNALAKAYNKQNGYSQSENNTSGSVSEPSNNNAQRVSSMQIPPVNKRTNSAAGYYGDDEQTTLLSQNVMEQTVRGILYFVHNQQSVTVDQDEVRIGKKADLVDYAINNSTSVSRQHAMITRRRGQFFLTDLGSTNGTFINNNRISGSVELQDGDNIRFADVICVFNIIE